MGEVLDSTSEPAVVDPAAVVDMADFTATLGRLRGQAGNPPFRTLAKQVGLLLRPPREVPFRTLADMFQAGRRRLDLDLIVATVQALGVSPQRTDDWRRAYLRAHAEAKANSEAGGVLRQLPADLPAFTGRVQHLQQLLEMTSTTNAPPAMVISAIEGMAGVGKTRLAVHLAHRLVAAGHFREGQLYANLRGFDPEQPPAEPAAVLEAFLRQLGVPAPRIPISLAERSAMFRDLLHDRRALVLLDNAADEEQVQDLLPGSASCLVLLTSRRALSGLDGAVTHQLDVFDEGEAVELLGKVAGRERVAAEPGAAQRIVETCGYLPLAVSLAASRLRSRPAWSLEHLADRLRQDAVGLKVGAKNLTGVFDLSYRGLPDDARRLFRLLGLFPGSDLTAPAAAALAGISELEAAALLEDLQDEHLLQQQRAGRYVLHDLLRGYARRRVSDEESPQRQHEAFERLMLWYTHRADSSMAAISPLADRPILKPSRYEQPFESSEEAVQWCRLEVANLADCLEAAPAHGQHTLAWQAAGAMWAYFRVASAWDDWLRCYNAGLDAARQGGDETGEAVMLGGLASRSTRTGDLDQAFTLLQETLELDIRRSNVKGQAVVLTNMGDLHIRQGDYEKAVEVLTKARSMARIANSSDGIATLNLGEALGLLGRHQEALQELNTAKAGFVAMDDLYLTASTYESLGRVHLHAGDTTSASTALRACIEIREAIGYRRGVGHALVLLGDVHHRAGCHDDARSAWQQATVISAEAEDRDNLEQAQARLKVLP